MERTDGESLCQIEKIQQSAEIVSYTEENDKVQFFVVWACLGNTQAYKHISKQTFPGVLQF